MSIKRLLLPIFILQLSAFAVLAQPVLEEIVITADYRQNALDDIPASITILDAQTIANKNAQHLEDILLNAPNVNFSSGGSRARFIQIRGIGERGQFSEPLNSSVGLLIDGVDFSGIGNAAMLYDMEQVEILLGPQGTRYGSNALAGLINLQTKAPTPELAWGMQLQAANKNTQGIAGYLSGPATDDLFYRLSFQKLSSDGFGTNQHLNQATNKRDETTLRGKFRWLMTATEQLDFTAAMVDLNNGYDMFSLDNIRDTLSDEPGKDKQNSKLGSLKFSSQRFEQFSLELMGAYAHSDIEYSYDEDWVFTGFHPWEYSSTDKYFRDRETISGELRLLSTDSGALLGSSTSWVAGLYSLHQDVDLARNYTFNPDIYTSRYIIDRLALYAETNTAIGDNWSIDLGLRSERFSAEFMDSNTLNFSPDDNLFGGKFSLNYRLANGSLLYTSASRGYKSGGFNTDGSLDADLREFDAETLWNYEAGFKGSAFNETMQLRLALFYMDREEVQISSSTVRVRDDGSAEFIDFIGNAAAGSNRGLELESQWLATENISVYGSLGLLDSRYLKFINSTGENLDGREQAHAPAYQFTLGAGIIFNPALSMDINIQGRDSFYFSDSHAIQSDSYTLLNASLRYAKENISMTLWGRNLTDEDYFVRGFYFGNDPRDGYTAKGYTQLGEPARLGLTLNLDF
ncbi:MAG: TonB-dependent receptor [Gammaproteobacteria bacterium]|jgi:iron complex outermembrane recepter protein|nr:TonB-dependent receptor [Gammaproteobacteria bacterium]MBT6044024.1 TonB-dependent receptor [Gammaproteobacteria bacterium]